VSKDELSCWRSRRGEARVARKSLLIFYLYRPVIHCAPFIHPILSGSRRVCFTPDRTGQEAIHRGRQSFDIRAKSRV